MKTWRRASSSRSTVVQAGHSIRVAGVSEPTVKAVRGAGAAWDQLPEDEEEDDGAEEGDEGGLQEVDGRLQKKMG